MEGAGVARDIAKARELFEEFPMRNLRPDTGAYNALLSSLVRCRDMESATGLMDEMEEKGIEHDNITYHTMFFGLMKSKNLDSVSELFDKMTKENFVPKTRTVVMLMKFFCANYQPVEHDNITYHTMFFGLMKSKNLDSVSELFDKMTKENFVPKTRTVVMLMKFFCANYQPDLGLNLWGYLLERGRCQHGHALDLLATSLCSHGKVQEAFECSKQMLERGRHVSEAVFRMLERFLLQAGDTEKLRTLDVMIKRLQNILPPSRGHATGILYPTKMD
ncbi:hypothetical protein CsSME_00048969 [Camellia sinensis var. sinensis]